MSPSIAWLAILAGSAFIFVAIRGAIRGDLSTQASVVVASRSVRRVEEPVRFWVNFLYYLLAGIALCLLGFRMLA